MAYSGPGRLQKVILGIFSSKSLLMKPFQHFFKMFLHLEIPPAFFRNGLVLVHPYSVQIAWNAKIGNNVTIFNNVTIGVIEEGISRGAPIIEDNVTIYPYSMIIGNITVGKGSVIGAGSILRTSVPPFSIVAGNPGKAINQGDSRFCVPINHGRSA